MHNNECIIKKKVVIIIKTKKIFSKKKTTKNTQLKGLLRGTYVARKVKKKNGLLLSNLNLLVYDKNKRTKWTFCYFFAP